MGVVSICHVCTANRVTLCLCGTVFWERHTPGTPGDGRSATWDRLHWFYGRGAATMAERFYACKAVCDSGAAVVAAASAAAKTAATEGERRQVAWHVALHWEWFLSLLARVRRGPCLFRSNGLTQPVTPHGPTNHVSQSHVYGGGGLECG